MNQEPATVVVRAAEEATTWPWLAEVENAINKTFDPIADAVSSAIFYAPSIFGAEVPLIVFWLVVAAAIFIQPVTFNPTGGLATTMSWLPFSSPIIMPLRLTIINVPTTELIGSLIVLLLSCLLVVWLAARIYRVGLLMYGKRPTLRELAHWIRYA